MDDSRFRSQRSPREDASAATATAMSLVTPPRNNGTRMPQQPYSAQATVAADSRSNLPRRFTTDSGRVPTLGSMSLTSPPRDYNQRDMSQVDYSQRGPGADFNNNVCSCYGFPSPSSGGRAFDLEIWQPLACTNDRLTNRYSRHFIKFNWWVTLPTPVSRRRRLSDSLRSWRAPFRTSFPLLTIWSTMMSNKVIWRDKWLI